jgi:hypothetical protein
MCEGKSIGQVLTIDPEKMQLYDKDVELKQL